MFCGGGRRDMFWPVAWPVLPFTACALPSLSSHSCILVLCRCGHGLVDRTQTGLGARRCPGERWRHYARSLGRWTGQFAFNRTGVLRVRGARTSPCFPTAPAFCQFFARCALLAGALEQALRLPPQQAARCAAPSGWSLLAYSEQEQAFLPGSGGTASTQRGAPPLTSIHSGVRSVCGSHGL